MDLDQARARYEAAAAILDLVAGPDGAVRHEDVDTLAEVARQLDDGVTGELRRAVSQAGDEWFRAGVSSATAASVSEAVEADKIVSPAHGGDVWAAIDYGTIDGEPLPPGGLLPLLDITVEL